MPQSAHPKHDQFVAGLNEVRESLSKITLGLKLTPFESGKLRGRLLYAAMYCAERELVPLVRALIETCETSAIEEGLLKVSELPTDRRQPVPQAN